jgi:hypothetical protein
MAERTVETAPNAGTPKHAPENDEPASLQLGSLTHDIEALIEGRRARCLPVDAIRYLQRSVGNAAVGRLLGQTMLNASTRVSVTGSDSDGVSAFPTSGKNTWLRDSTLAATTTKNEADRALIQRQTPGTDPNLSQRVDVLERRQTATEMDLRWRARFGGRLAVYRQAIYALTTAFQTASTNFGQAHSDQAQAEAIKDQVGITIINVAVAGAAEPILRAGLGRLGPRLNAVVEFIENPLLAAGQGAMATAGTVSGQTGGARPPTGPPPGGAGGDPLTFLTQNLQEVERHSQLIETAFSTRSTRMESFTPEQWMRWDRGGQEAEYVRLFQALDSVALSDVAQLEAPPTLAIKLELYFWARWLSNQYIPGVRGLQLGAHLARRLKAIGVESLAGVTFDTTSWIFMDHSPENWDQLLVGWARGYRARLTR